jgi:hypothetical protein
MQKSDLTQLDDRLRQIADALGGKSVGAAGLKVWLDVLSGERFDDVLSVLTDWCRKNSRMPHPADVLKECQSRVSNRIEAQAKANRDSAIGLEEALALAKGASPNSAIAKRELAKILSILGTRSGGFIAGSFQHIGGFGPSDDHKAWAKKLQQRESDGEQLSLTQAQAWREALGVGRNELV